MKIGVISDTHDNTNAVVWIIKYLNKNQIKVALHAGDLISPGIIRRFRDNYEGHLHFVFGNNDGEISSITKLAETSDNLTCHNRDMSMEFDGRKFFMNHYQSHAIALAKTQDYDVCVGGHLHHYIEEKFGNTLFLNPGNTTTDDPWIADEHKNQDRTFIVLETKDLSVEKIVLPKDYVEESWK